MAAGLGFKTFTTGEVLTAADTNGYLMQGVLVFASAAARDAAITSPQEGQCCYLKDTDAVLTYSGAAWVGFDDSNAIQNTIVDAKGDIVAASASDTPARLAVGADYGFLQAFASAGSTGLQWNAGAYTSYTPVLTSGTGTFTSASVTGEYKRIGKVCIARVQVSIVTNGTAGGTIIVTNPFTSTASANGTWREVQSTGVAGQMFLTSSTQFGLVNNDNSYPGANSRIFQGTIIYEVA